MVASTAGPPVPALLPAISLLNILCFSGIVFGWSSVRLMLESELPDFTADDAAAIFSVASFLVVRGSTSINGVDITTCRLHHTLATPAASTLLSYLHRHQNGISVPSGTLLDKAGGATTAACAGFAMTTGLVMFGLSETAMSFTFAYSLIAVGGQMTLFGEEGEGAPDQIKD